MGLKAPSPRCSMAQAGAVEEERELLGQVVLCAGQWLRLRGGDVKV